MNTKEEVNRRMSREKEEEQLEEEEAARKVRQRLGRLHGHPSRRTGKEAPQHSSLITNNRPGDSRPCRAAVISLGERPSNGASSQPSDRRPRRILGLADTPGSEN